MTIINWVFRKKNPVFDMMKKAGGGCQKGIPIVGLTDFKMGSCFAHQLYIYHKCVYSFSFLINCEKKIAGKLSFSFS